MASLNQILADKNKKAPETKKPNFGVRMIHFSKLVPNPNNREVKRIDELADLILLSGEIKENLLIKKIDSDKFEIISGHRRYKAVVMLIEKGHKEFEFLPCKVEGEDDILSQFMLYVSNIRQDLTDFEMMKAVTQLKELIPQLTEDEELKGRALRRLVSDSLKISETKVAQLDAINNNLITEGKEKFEAGEIGVTKAYNLSALPKEKQQEILEKQPDIQAKDIKKNAALNDIEKKAILGLAQKESVIDILTYNQSKNEITEALKNVYGETGGCNGDCNYNFRYSGKVSIQVKAYDQREMTWSEFAGILIEAFGKGELKTTYPIEKPSPMEEGFIINALKSHFTESQTDFLIDAYKAAGTIEEEVNVLKDFILSDLEQKEIMHRYKRIVFQDNNVLYYSQLHGEPKRKIYWETIAGLFGKALEQEWIKRKVETVSESDTKSSVSQPETPENKPEEKQNETVFQFLKSADIIEIARWLNERFICPQSSDTCPRQQQEEPPNKEECEMCWLVWLRSEKG